MSANTVKSKIENVKTLFERPSKYLEPRGFDIRIRVETVDCFTKDLMFDHALDIGCGDGSLSLPLLSRCRRLTLLDVSSSMLELARRKIPSESLDQVDLINDGFIDAALSPGSFDFILCVGVLAHVDSPAAIIAEIARLARPGATVILEFTDSFHFWGVPVVLYQKLLKLLRPEPYALNRLRHRQVMEMCRKNGFRTTALYRYGLPPLGTPMFAGQDKMYAITRQLFGPTDRNRTQWMGNEFIYRLEKL